jgi:hypothetical protein
MKISDLILRQSAKRQVGPREATSQEQWEKAEEILTQGMAHWTLKKIKKAYDDFVAALAEGKTRNEGMKKRGVGSTEAPTFVTNAVEDLDALATEAKKVVDTYRKIFK